MTVVNAAPRTNKRVKSSDLTDQEIRAVCDYKGQGYIKVNQYLRIPENERYKDNSLESTISLISKAISKKKLSGEGRFYKGIHDMRRLAVMIPDYEFGVDRVYNPYVLLDQVIKDTGFMSTSKSFEVAKVWSQGLVVFVIDSNDGDMKMDFEDVDFKKIGIKECDLPLEEKEVLFDKGQVMRVNSVKETNKSGDPKYIIEVSIIKDE